MKTWKFVEIMAFAALAILLSALTTTSASATLPAVEWPEPVGDAPANVKPPLARSVQAQQTIVVDHSTVDVTAIPQQWIEEAKRTLHIAYGHTSHGSQLITGMTGLVSFANGGGKGLSLPQDIFAWNNGGTDGALDLHDRAMGGDVGYYPQWVNNTRDYLGTPDPETGRGTNQPDVNVIIWSWCGQASGYTEQTMITNYLDPMTQLEQDYPGVTFVYMTGHADGTGEDGNLHQRNQQIREYCVQNDKVLYDFYDIELYDPDGNYYGDKAVNDNCDYDSDGNGSRDRNWATDWQGSHTQDEDWYGCSCAHSQALNCNQKAYAAWWLWARLAGWSGVTEGDVQVTPSNDTVQPGQAVTFTVTVRDLAAPPTATVYLTNAVPAGLAYVPGSLAATTGLADDGGAPTLRWSGMLTPTPVVTVAFAAEVTYGGSSGDVFPHYITHTAIVDVPGYQTLTRTATITVERSPDMADLSPSYKIASRSFADYGERVTYTIGIRSNTGPLAGTVYMTDTLPEGQQYVPGTFSATSGQTALLPVLRWSGVLSPTPAVTLTYAVTVTRIVTGTILLPRTDVNTATIAYEDQTPIVRTATLRTHWANVFLPLVMRD
ncbi:MAG TPA: DUF11 domain-containing protein [Chloroflexi bacterium]|nr:DUF11 domain-containing protein [Chloroflexota bacterium]